MKKKQNKKMMAFERVCEARHIDCACVVCGDDNSEELIIEKIDDSAKRMKKNLTQDEIYDEILKLPNEEILKRYTILCYNCSAYRQYLFAHKRNKPELQEEYNKMMEKIKQEF